MKFTIFGGSGFVGSHLKTYLLDRGHTVATPARGTEKQYISSGEDLGHVIYGIGLTGNFRQQPAETVEAHVSKLTDLLYDAKFSSWLYLSSTRVYGEMEQDELASETSKLPITPTADSLYNLSKLLGEAVCLGCDNVTVRVARLSNVYGNGQSNATFLGSILCELQEVGSVAINEAPQSSKDYISVAEVCTLLELIALQGRERTYNIATGVPVTHDAIAAKLRDINAGSVSISSGGPVRCFPKIDNERIKNEFDYRPQSFIDNLSSLWKVIASGAP